MIFLPLLLLSGSLLAQGTTTNVQSLAKRQDKKCSPTMCVEATVQGSTTEYILSSTGMQNLGWMAMGFGTSMTNSEMVIMWTNSDGSITLSQRSTQSRTEPRVVSSPRRVATVLPERSVTTGSTVSLAFSIPSNSDTTQNIIHAFGLDNPNSPDAGATLRQHYDYGTQQLSLADSSSTTGTGTATGTATGRPTATNTPGDSETDDIPLTKYQKMIVVHGIFTVVGFLLLLPVGSLLARYVRTFTPIWFTSHWIVQAGISGPVIVVGVAFGFAGVNESAGVHLSDDHKRWGLAIFILYLIQCFFGAFIHFVKFSSFSGRRPPQNYVHAIVGILTIALAFKQVRSGYKTEWRLTGLDALPKSVDRLWLAWVVIIPVIYILGLGLLPRQYKQERASRVKRHEDSTMLNNRVGDVYSD